MPRTRGMIGPGSARMGGGGAKPGMPRTPMAGAPAPRPPGGPGGLGAGPPPRVRPPVGPPVGLAGPAPGGAPVGPPPGAGAGGIGASGGFRKGGRAERFGREEKEEKFGKKMDKFAKGGVVRGGGDAKPRHKSSGSFK